MFGKGIGCHCLRGDEYQYGPAGGVGYGLEYVTFHDHEDLKMQLIGCKYTQLIGCAKYFFIFFSEVEK
jgi:hypothetical protein